MLRLLIAAICCLSVSNASIARESSPIISSWGDWKRKFPDIHFFNKHYQSDGTIYFDAPKETAEPCVLEALGDSTQTITLSPKPAYQNAFFKVKSKARPIEFIGSSGVYIRMFPAGPQHSLAKLFFTSGNKPDQLEKIKRLVACARFESETSLVHTDTTKYDSQKVDIIQEYENDAIDLFICLINTTGYYSRSEKANLSAERGVYNMYFEPAYGRTHYYQSYVQGSKNFVIADGINRGFGIDNREDAKEHLNQIKCLM